MGLLGAGLDSPEAEDALTGLLRDGRAGSLPFVRLLAGSAVDLVREHFVSEELRSLAAPWPLHLGTGPEDPAGALWTAFALAALVAGNPTPVGGSGRLAEALTGLVTERGGDVHTGVDVDVIVTRDGRAAGVRTSAGQTVEAAEAVIVSTTPDQLYGRLLRGVPGVPAGVRDQAARYRYRRGAFQVNLALSAQPRFQDSRLDAGGTHHLGRGLNALVTSVRQAEAGLLPEHPMIAWHEPTVVDPTRAPEGRGRRAPEDPRCPPHPDGRRGGRPVRQGGLGPGDRRGVRRPRPRRGGTACAGPDRPRAGALPDDARRPRRGEPERGPGDRAAGENSLAQALIQRPIAPTAEVTARSCPAHG